MTISSVYSSMSSSYIRRSFSNASTQKEEKQSSFLDTFKELKEELGEKIKNGDTDVSIPTGSMSFTVKEWDSFMKKFDKMEEVIKKEVQEEVEQKKQAESDLVESLDELSGKTPSIMERLTADRKNYPYSYLAKDGMIEYNGITFMCDELTNSIQLGDCSEPKNCIRVPMEKGGTLIFNREEIGGLSQAIGMFSPEDQRRILCAIADDKKIQSTQKEIDEDTNSIGEENDSEENENKEDEI